MSTATQVALALPMLLGFGALGVDIGYMRYVDAELQAAADAAALAGAAFLGDEIAVRDAARTVALRNKAAGQPVVLTDAQIEIGTWDGASWVVDSAGTQVRVQTTMSGNATFFGRLIGTPTFAVNGTAIAGGECANGGPLECGIFADSNIELNGTAVVDGYDSTDPCAAGDPKKAYACSSGSTASVCSNLTDVKTQGTIKIQGDVHPGPDGSVTIKGSSSVSGNTDPLQEAIDLDPVVKPIACPRQYLMPSDVKTLKIFPAKEDYCYNGSFTVTGLGQVAILGKTVIYVDGDVSIDGKGFANTSQDPRNLTIMVVGKHSVHVNGTSAFYGTIYAPESEVEINGTADFYGAVMGDYVHLNGTGQVHVDQSLIAEFAPTKTGECAVANLVF